MFSLALPVLAYLLFIAHLKFHGLTMWILVPLFLILVMFIPSKWIARLQQLALLCFSIEWLITGYEMYVRRIAYGQPWHVGVSIMAGCALFTLLAAMVFYLPSVKRHFNSWKPGKAA